VSSENMPPPPARMLQLITGRFVSHAIGVAAHYDLATHLVAGPMTATALAARTETDGRSVYRLLRALASVGVFTETAPGTFANTPLSETLRSDRSDSSRAFALLMNYDMHVNTWLGLAHSVKTGQNATEHVHGQRAWDLLEANPAFAQVFNNAMTSLSSSIAQAVVSAYDFAGIDELVDVGGGHGFLLSAILSAHASMRGVLFDLPSVVEGAGQLLQARGVASRVRVTGGDFFEEVPASGAYIMKHILHDWSDADATRILATIRRAARPGARLLLAESIIRFGNEPDPAKLIDLEMLVFTTGGLERTEDQWKALLGGAGFSLERVVPTPSMVSLIEARAV